MAVDLNLTACVWHGWRRGGHSVHKNTARKASGEQVQKVPLALEFISHWVMLTCTCSQFSGVCRRAEFISFILLCKATFILVS